MRKLIIKWGRIWSTLLIVSISIFISLTTSVLIMWLFARVTAIGITIALIAPAVIAAPLSWYVIGLLIKIHHMEVEQRHLASYDSLTGVMSRRAFFSNCFPLVNLTQLNGGSLVLAYIDIDNFKKINDLYGHAGGDMVLTRFADCLKKHLGSRDVPGRVGGEEFAVLFPDQSVSDVQTVLRRICRELAHITVKHQKGGNPLTISVGLAELNENNQVGVKTLVCQADKALYQAKNTGKNRMVVFSPSEV